MPRSPSLRDGAIPQRTGSLIPRCPTCGRSDRADEEQSGSARRWFFCARCGVRYAAVPPAVTGANVRR
jgi:hypothetical protein